MPISGTNFSSFFQLFLPCTQCRKIGLKEIEFESHVDNNVRIFHRPTGAQADGGRAGASGASASTHASRARQYQRPSRPGTAPPGTTRAGSKSSRSESVHPVSDTAGARPWKSNSESRKYSEYISLILTLVSLVLCVHYTQTSSHTLSVFC